MKSIHVNDIGPVTEFEYGMEAPGVHVLRGRQGAGKTTILRTVQLATDGRTDIKPTKRDGTRNGTAVVAGKTLRISKKVMEDGEISVDGLGDLNISDLHSPKFMDAVTRDKHRIKTLIRLAGVAADATVFHDLLGGPERFADIVDDDAIQTDDMVELAARIKRAIEKAAQHFESQAQRAESDALACMKSCEGINLKAPHDEGELQEALSAAIESRAAIEQKRKSASEARERAAKAKAQLDAMPKGATVESCEASLADMIQQRDRAAKHVLSLESQLIQARADLTTADGRVESARSTMSAVKSREAMAAGWRADIDAADYIDCPSDQDLNAAIAAVDRATDAQTNGTRIRMALESQERAKKYAGDARIHKDEAESLRKAASMTNEVLSIAVESIPDCPLTIKTNDDGDTRLVVKTDRSDAEPFDDLSDGERWPIILRIAAGKNRLIVLPQAAFGELSPETRAQLDTLARENDCYILTAQSDDGELRGEPYSARQLAHAH